MCVGGFLIYVLTAVRGSGAGLDASLGSGGITAGILEFIVAIVAIVYSL